MLVLAAVALRLMTYNVNFANTDQGSTLDAIAHADADVVLLQAVDASWQRLLEARFDKRYPYRIVHLHERSPGGIAVLSKLPISDEMTLASPNTSWFPAQRMVVTTSVGRVQILNIHLRPAIDQGSWVKGYFTTPPLRLREVESYWPKLARELPTIVAGDFNEAPDGSALAFLAKHRLSRVAPDGPRTWHYVEQVKGKPAELLKMDIDHVMISPALSASDAHVLDVGTSDHRPVIVTIGLRDRER
jgi:endonuclease/exonuclease/phosphatase family metal-dependent hydrolase